MNFMIIRMRSVSPRDYYIMVLFFFVFLTCRHLISSASPVHPLLNCSSACALWHQCLFFPSPSLPPPSQPSLFVSHSNAIKLQTRRHCAFLLRRRLWTAGLEEHQLSPGDWQLCGLERRPAHLQGWEPAAAHVCIISEVGPRLTSSYIFIPQCADSHAVVSHRRWASSSVHCQSPALCYWIVFHRSIVTGLTLTLWLPFFYFLLLGRAAVELPITHVSLTFDHFRDRQVSCSGPA